MNNRGITLIELIVVISIITILVIAAGITIPGLVGKYNIENQVKIVQADLMSARVRAMENNRVHFVTLTATGYAIYEDTSPIPDGNGTLETAADNRMTQRAFDTRYPITWTNAADTQIDINTKGIINLNDARTIWVTPVDTSLNAEYDCIAISQTRINIGKWNGASCDQR
ncbi:MAG: prepilin-type N-terminal cleavage/methylation domain-containing protein [Nitrospirota bacterium]